MLKRWAFLCLAMSVPCVLNTVDVLNTCSWSLSGYEPPIMLILCLLDKEDKKFVVSPSGISSPYFLNSRTEYGELKHSGRTIKSKVGLCLRASVTSDSTLRKFACLSGEAANWNSAMLSLFAKGFVIMFSSGSFLSQKYK